MTYQIPGGKEKGVALAAATMDSLTYWAKRIGDTLDAGKAQNPDRDKRLHAALLAEIARREGGGKPAPAAAPKPAAEPKAAPAPAALVVRAEKLAGSYHRPDAAMAMLREAAAVGHLITPQTSCGELPVGCSLATSLVWVDANTETYGIPHSDSDRRGLDKTALAKISAAAGITWDPVLSCRLDNGRDPFYVHYRAVGSVRNFDGTWRTEPGQVEQDLRDGGAEFNRCTEKELPVRRQFILRHAETKAINRVIRRLGLRTHYTRADLEKPFIVVKVMFTGVTDDPDLKRLFAEKTFEAFHGGRAALYGGQRHATPALPAPIVHDLPHDPPPVGEVVADDDWSDYPDEPALPANSSAVDVPAQVVPSAPARAVPATSTSTPSNPQSEMKL